MPERAPIRLLFFLNSPVRAGVEEVVLALIKRMDPKCFELHLAAPQALLDAFGSELHGCGVHTLPLHLYSFRQWGQIRRFLSYLRQWRIEIINSHMFYATLFAAPLGRLAGVPVILETTHGPEAWRNSWWKRKYWIDQCVERLVTANIAVSEANRRYLREQKRYPAGKLHVIPNGRDVACYSSLTEAELAGWRQRLGLSPHHRVVSVIARLESQKGHRFLVDALPEVTRRYPTLRALFVGDGSFRQSLQEQVRSLELQDHVIFTGFQSDVRPFYQLPEFLVLPSLYEGMPLTAIEAGAASRALVATAVDGTTEVILDGETGLLVPPQSPPALATALLDLLGQPEKARHMGNAARHRVGTLFSLDRQVEQTSQFYQRFGHSYASKGGFSC